jgi:hypothetical protein
MQSVRQGQIEFGIVEHEGREFVALGASVAGRDITAYTRLRHGEISLTRWGGQTLVEGRSEIVERFPDGSLALIFRLGRGRFLAGYALGDNGMLFRGELVEDSEAEARWTARMISDHFAEIDAKDEADTGSVSFGTEEENG